MKISKISLSLFWNNSNVFSWDGTSTLVGTQYLNSRPEVSVIEMLTWGLSICSPDLGSQYLNYRLGVLVFEMQTWGLTIGPPGLDNPGFKWLPNIHLLSIVSLSSNVVVPKFKTPNSKHTIFYPEYFLLLRKCYHIWHTKHHCQQNKSSVAMLPCVLCSFEALSEKHLKMHMQKEHYES